VCVCVCVCVCVMLTCALFSEFALFNAVDDIKCSPYSPMHHNATCFNGSYAQRERERERNRDTKDREREREREREKYQYHISFTRSYMYIYIFFYMYVRERDRERVSVYLTILLAFDCIVEFVNCILMEVSGRKDEVDEVGGNVVADVSAVLREGQRERDMCVRVRVCCVCERERDGCMCVGM